MARNSIAKTLIVLYSIKKEISEIYRLQNHQSSIMYSFIFIHSVMSENDKNRPLIVCDFHTKGGN